MQISKYKSPGVAKLQRYIHHVVVDTGARESVSSFDCMSPFCSICFDKYVLLMTTVYWQQLTLCIALQEPTPSAVTAPIGISTKSKKARTSKGDDALLMPFEFLTQSQQRLSESLLLFRLADENRDCIVQVLQIGGFMKYLVLSILLHVPAGLCMNDMHMSTPVFESTLTTLCKLSAGHVSVLAIDMHILQRYQIVHTICYCGELNI